MIEKILTQILKEQIIQNRWYLGRGRNTNIGLSYNDLFLTLCPKFNQWVVKLEGYYEENCGCFQPFSLIDEQQFKKTEKIHLEKYKWYYGNGQHSNIVLWNGEKFLTIANRGQKYTGDFLEEEKKFVPYCLISEGEMIEPFGKITWDAHYGKKLLLKIE